MQTLKDFMIDQLKELYNAEIQMKIINDKMAYQTSNEDLRHTFEQLSKGSETQLSKLMEIFSMMGIDKGDERYAYIIEGVGKEVQDFVEKNLSSEVRDAGFIALAQKAKHYSIALSGTLRAYAHELGNHKAQQLLTELLDEAKASDNQFSEKATSGINQRATKPMDQT